MNTGLHDVWNLVWKLDLVLHGHGNEQLLESYSAERRPVIKHVIETTDFLTKVMGTPSKLAQTSARCRHTHGVASGAFSARLRAEAFRARHCLSAEARLLKGPASGTSMIRCVAAMAFAAASSSCSIATPTHRPKQAAKQFAESFERYR